MNLMKKLSTLLFISFAFILGLTQCKKKVDTIATPSDPGKTVYITVNVGGDKHQVFPNTGAVVYTDGDRCDRQFCQSRKSHRCKRHL